MTASLRGHEAPRFAKMTGKEIADATSILQRHPLIGRPAPRNLRELVISIKTAKEYWEDWKRRQE